MKLQTAIENERGKLIRKVEKSGLYENFGQKEVGKLTDKYIDLSSYTKEMNENRALIRDFDNWCMSYNG